MPSLTPLLTVVFNVLFIVCFPNLFKCLEPLPPPPIAPEMPPIAPSMSISPTSKSSKPLFSTTCVAAFPIIEIPAFPTMEPTIPTPVDANAPLAAPEINAAPTPSKAFSPSIIFDATCAIPPIKPPSKPPTAICQKSPLSSVRITGLLSQ